MSYFLFGCLFFPAVFERAFDYFRTNEPELKEERAMLLDDWLSIESSFGSVGDLSVVKKKLPRKVKRRRPIASEDESNVGYDSLSPLCPMLSSVFLSNIGIANFAGMRNILTTFSRMKRLLQSLRFWKLHTSGKSNEQMMISEIKVLREFITPLRCKSSFCNGYNNPASRTCRIFINVKNI